MKFVDYGFRYSGTDSQSISHVSLDLPPGKVISVITAQGRGKTTFLRAAAGLLGEIYQGETTGRIEEQIPVRPAVAAAMTPPASDAAWMLGSRASEPRAESRRREPGATAEPRARPGAFFDGYVQVTLAVETVREEIGLPLYASGITRADRDARVSAVTRELKIENLLDRNVTALSGGEEKLVGIAAALVPDTGTYILDEPFEQLDVAHLSAVIHAAKQRARAGRLVLVATGSIDTAINIADAAVVFDGATWKYIDAPTYADVSAIAGLGASSLGDFLESHHENAGGVRRFRDGVAKVS